MAHRLGLLSVGLTFVILAVLSFYCTTAAAGTFEVAGHVAKGVFFAVVGLCMVVGAIKSDGDTARWLLSDFFRDLFSRRNLTDVAMHLVIIGFVVAVMVLFDL